MKVYFTEEPRNLWFHGHNNVFASKQCLQIWWNLTEVLEVIDWTQQQRQLTFSHTALDTGAVQTSDRRDVIVDVTELLDVSDDVSGDGVFCGRWRARVQVVGVHAVEHVLRSITEIHVPRLTGVQQSMWMPGFAVWRQCVVVAANNSILFYDEWAMQSTTSVVALTARRSITKNR